MQEYTFLELFRKAKNRGYTDVQDHDSHATCRYTEVNEVEL